MEHTPTIENYGWDSFFEERFRQLAVPGAVPARIVAGSRGTFRVASAQGELSAVVAGKVHYTGEETGLRPAVGDWVAVNPLPEENKAVIVAVLPRKTVFSRKAAGEKTEEQVVAANVDTVFVVSGLDGGRSFNLRRLERYLTLAWNSGASPVIVLNKADVCPDVSSFVTAADSIAPGVPVYPVSARDGTGLDSLRAYLEKGRTIGFLGMSGVGKSALINALLGAERQATGDVRDDDRAGRHTTTHRELFLVPGGGMVVDTPGMRELQMLAGGGYSLRETFSDIEELARQCRFKDCTHNAEAGCAVIEAVESGELDPARLESYRKLQGEMNYLAAREEQSARQVEKSKWKNIAKSIKDYNKKYR